MFFFNKKKKQETEDEENLTIQPNSSVDISQFQIETAANAPFKVGKVHEVGRRKYQQDTLAYSDIQNQEVLEKKGAIFLVADGMGGLENGAEVSSMLAVKILEYFDQHDFAGDVDAALREMVLDVNESINDYLGDDKIGKSGTTLVLAYVKNHEAHWISVGDSNVYLYHDNKITRVNQLHNYEAELVLEVERGEMTEAEASNHPDKAALTSYIGIGELVKIDQSKEPIWLESGDRLLLTSDGINTIELEELEQLMHYDVKEAALKLRYAIEEKNKKNQDNFTAMMIEDIQ